MMLRVESRQERTQNEGRFSQQHKIEGEAWFASNEIRSKHITLQAEKNETSM
jgi:hypothetical protein